MSFHIPDVPLTDPVAYFAVVTAVFLVVPILFERLGVPGLIGLILVGAALGPNGSGLLARDQVTGALGTAGLLFLMFQVGLELDLIQFRKHRSQSLVFGLSSFALPMGLGVGVWLWLGHDIWASLLLGGVFASHTLIAYPIASRLGIVKTRAVTTALGGVLITDILALLVLAVVVGHGSGDAGLTFWLGLVGSLFGFGVFALVLVPWVSGWFFRRLAGDGASDFAFTMAVLFGTSFAAEFAGIESIIGALLCGLALNRFIPEHSTLMSRIHFASDTVFVPFFLIAVGMLVDVRAIADPSNWGVIIILTAGVIFGKAAASWVTARVFGFRSEEGWILFGLSVPHAASTMAIVLVGFRMGYFEMDVVNSLVVVVLVTSLIGPAAMTRFGRKVALAEEQAPIAPGAAPSRILISLSNPETRDGLIDLAMLLRERGSGEPLFPLQVVQDDGAGAEASVARAERMLGHVVLHASSASVPVSPLTRVDQNVATGIARAVAETRASTIVMGWDRGRAVVPQAVFGSVLDQVLSGTRAQVVVARLARSLTADKVHLLIPPFSHRHPGFADAVSEVRAMAAQLSAPLHVTVITGQVDEVREAIDQAKGAGKVHYTQATWRELLDHLQKQMGANDMVVLLSAREDTLPWHPRLPRLLKPLSDAVGQRGLLVMFPGESRPAAEEMRAPSHAIELPDILAENRIVSDLTVDDHKAALERLLNCEFIKQPVQRQLILDALFAAVEEDTTELRPGVVLPHVRVKGIDRSLVFLGLTKTGIEFPHASQPATVILLLISPLEAPEEHLRALSAIAGLCADDGWLADVMAGNALPVIGTEDS